MNNENRMTPYATVTA